jgi:aminopeptidase N
MAEYLTFVYDDEVNGESVSLATTAAWKYYSRFAGYYPVPDERPPLLEYYGDVYGAGPVVLFRQIEALFSRAEVMQALALLLGTERAIGVADVKAALEQTTGADLTAYFARWVTGEGAPTWPLFGVTLTDRGAGDWDVTVTQANAEAGLFGTAFAIRLTGDNGESEDVWIDLGPDGKAIHTVAASPGFPVTNHRFDPKGHTLAIEGPAPTAAPTPRPTRTNPWVAAKRP